MKRGDLIRHLRQHGCVLYEEGARHSRWMNAQSGVKTVIGRHKEIDNKMARIICRQLGIPEIGK